MLNERNSERFAENGYRGTSVIDIAGDVGLTRAAIYRYFKNKELLVEAMMNEKSSSRTGRSESEYGRPQGGHSLQTDLR